MKINSFNKVENNLQKEKELKKLNKLRQFVNIEIILFNILEYNKYNRYINEIYKNDKFFIK